MFQQKGEAAAGTCCLEQGYIFCRCQWKKFTVRLKERSVIASMEGNNLNKKSNLGKTYDFPMIIVSVAVIFVFVILTAVRPESTMSGLNAIFNWMMRYFGSIMEILVVGLVLVSLYFCINGKWGKIKFGEGKPQYNMFTYIAMMTLAALGCGTFCFSWNIWASYYQAPGLGMEPGSTEALEASTAYAYFHWGVGVTAIYVILGLAMSYSYYIRKKPALQLGHICVDMMGDKVKPGVKKGFGKVIDFVVILGIIGGLAGSLGVIAPLITQGLTALFGIETGFGTEVCVILVVALVFIITSFIGVEKGMKNLSNISAGLCIALMIYVFFAGDTGFILKNSTNAIGWLMEIMPRGFFFTDPVENSGFPEMETIFYWAWGFNYACMMGVFIVRISKGRTVRQLALGALFGISIASAVIFGVFGSYGMDLHLDGKSDIVELVNSGLGESAVYNVVANLPGGSTIVVVVVMLISIGFLASTLDSSSLALAETTTRVTAQGGPNRWMRVFWCIVLTLVPLAILSIGATFDIFKRVAIIVSIPFMFVVLFMGIQFIRWMLQDAKDGKLEQFGIKAEAEDK